ncbi:MAG: 3'-5' exonuclease [Caulobacteraceae bacterium]
MNFIALDFETANARLSSICQVGIVSFKDGSISETYSSLVDPADFFDAMNVSIHGIDEAAVRGAPRFANVYPEILRRTENAVVACHSLFDRAALVQATEAIGLSCVTCQWLDTTRVVRRTWPQYARSGYGLANVTRDFGIPFNHHDAAEDARATGLVLLRALQGIGTVS